MIQTIDIPQASANTVERLQSGIRSGKPLKISGLIGNWPVASWTMASLREQAGDNEVTVMTELPATGGLLDGGQESYESRMTFARFVDLIESQERKAPCYLGYCRPEALFPGYGEAFDFSALTGPVKEPTDTRLWIGSAGTCSGLHSDLKDNLFAQVHGRKRVLIVPFAQTKYVYPFIDNIVNSRVDPNNVDLKAFPRFARADIHATVMKPGEVIFIPRGWWHHIQSDSSSISINHWFGPQINAAVFLRLLIQLGPRYVSRTLADMVRYSVLRQSYKKDFFFTPPSTGERLYNLIRHGNFSRENDPALLS